MFDRCDPDTMRVIDTGLAEARRLGHHWLGTEHLLLALVQQPVLLPERVADILPTADQVRSALPDQISGPPRPDAELLATLGIDLGAVHSTVRQTFGTDAVERVTQRRVHQPWQPWRRPSRRCTSLLGGSMRVAPRAKEALDHAAQDASRRGRTAIEPADLLLGIIEVESALANKLLRDSGVEPTHIQRALRDTR